MLVEIAVIKPARDLNVQSPFAERLMLEGSSKGIVDLAAENSRDKCLLAMYCVTT